MTSPSDPELAQRGNCWERFKYELKMENLWHNGDYPNTYGRLNWVKAFGGAGSGCCCCATNRKYCFESQRAPFTQMMSNEKWLLWRAFVFIFLFGVMLWSPIVAWDNSTWLYYLTNWQTCLFGLYSLSAMCTTAYIQIKYHDELVADLDVSNAVLGVDNDSKIEYHMPIFVRITWILHGFALSLGLWVTTMFWTGIYSVKDRFEPVHLIDHVITMTIILIDFSMSAFPWLLLQFVWSVLIAVTYLVWTIIHYEVNLHNKFDNERYIYPIADWSHPKQTLAIFLPSIVFGIPLFSILLWFVTSEAGCFKRIVPWAKYSRSISNIVSDIRDGLLSDHA